MTTGKIIQKIRKEKGYTQKQLAEKCGVATGTIQQYELNKREPRQEQLRKIAKALDVSIDYLKTGKSSDELWEEIMHDVYKSSIGVTIREEREKQGLTQKELADYTGLTETSIKECERTTETQEKSFLEDYRKLNGLGQSEARKRVNELTEIKKYTEIEDEFYE